MRHGTGVFILCLILLLTGCGTDQRKDALEKCQQAEAMLAQGDVAGAEDMFRAALRLNPYLLRANWGYGRILCQYRHDELLAAAYLRRAVELADNEPELERLAREKVALLEAVAAGQIEDPIDAFADVMATVNSGNRKAFASRLHDGLVFRLVQERGGSAWLFNNWRSRYRKRGYKVVKRSLDSGFARVRIEYENSSDNEMRDYFFVAMPTGDWLLAGFDTVKEA